MKKIILLSALLSGCNVEQAAKLFNALQAGIKQDQRQERELKQEQTKIIYLREVEPTEIVATSLLTPKDEQAELLEILTNAEVDTIANTLNIPASNQAALLEYLHYIEPAELVAMQVGAVPSFEQKKLLEIYGSKKKDEIKTEVPKAPSFDRPQLLEFYNTKPKPEVTAMQVGAVPEFNQAALLEYLNQAEPELVVMHLIKPESDQTALNESYQPIRYIEYQSKPESDQTKVIVVTPTDEQPIFIDHYNKVGRDEIKTIVLTPKDEQADLVEYLQVMETDTIATDLTAPKDEQAELLEFYNTKEAPEIVAMQVEPVPESDQVEQVDYLNQAKPELVANIVPPAPEFDQEDLVEYYNTKEKPRATITALEVPESNQTALTEYYQPIRFVEYNTKEAAELVTTALTLPKDEQLEQLETFTTQTEDEGEEITKAINFLNIIANMLSKISIQYVLKTTDLRHTTPINLLKALYTNTDNEEVQALAVDLVLEFWAWANGVNEYNNKYGYRYDKYINNINNLEKIIFGIFPELEEFKDDIESSKNYNAFTRRGRNKIYNYKGELKISYQIGLYPNYLVNYYKD